LRSKSPTGPFVPWDKNPILTQRDLDGDAPQAVTATSWALFGQASFAISYGLGQGATMVAAFWGVFIWREFRDAPRGTMPLLALMFVGYIAGLALVIVSRVV